MRGRRDRGTVRACVRACEAVGEYPSDAVGYWIRYSPHDTRDDRARHRQPRSSCRQPRSAPLVDRQSTLTELRSGGPNSLRLTYPCKRLMRSVLPITQYNSRNIEWGFTL